MFVRNQIRGTNGSMKRSLLNIILAFSPFLLIADDHEDSIEVIDCSTASGQEEVSDCLAG